MSKQNICFSFSWISYSFLLCVDGHVCVHVFMCGYLSMWVGRVHAYTALGGQKTISAVLSQDVFHFHFWDRISNFMWVSLIWILCWLAVQRGLGIWLSLPPYPEYYKHVQPKSSLLCKFWTMNSSLQASMAKTSLTEFSLLSTTAILIQFLLILKTMYLHLRLGIILPSTCAMCRTVVHNWMILLYFLYT